MPEAYIGVDWGTHSSKWCYQDSRNRKLVGQIWDSTVWRVGESLAMHPIGLRYKGDRGEGQLKRKLIRDPDQPFWEGERRKLGATLGEAIVFSLYSLLSDAQKTLKSSGVSLDDMGPVSVRFSHPNWVTPDTVTALQCYRDAAVVALSALHETPEETTSKGSLQITAGGLKDLVARHGARISSLGVLPPLYDHNKYQECLKGSVENIRWEFVFESCAAGFPYLIQAEPEVFNPEELKYAEHAWVRKILVVDIGAGSTDSGYMLRTIQRDSRTYRPVRPLLIWLPAAPAFERAGNWLTDRILEDWIKEGRPARTFAEAEDYKTSGVTAWYTKAYVDEWCCSIAERVAEYMRTVPDMIRLPKEPHLQIVVTGGSSAVQPIKRHLIDGVKQALKERGIGTQLSGRTSLIDPPTSDLLGRGYTDVQAAQLAVSLGASHPRMTELKHYPQGL